MAEHASLPDFETPPGTPRGRRTTRPGSATSRAASPEAPPSSASRPSRSSREPVLSSSAADNYAFYFLIATVAAGLIAMVILALTI